MSKTSKLVSSLKSNPVLNDLGTDGMIIPNHSGRIRGDSFQIRWEDLRIPVNAIRLSGTKPPAWTDYKGGQVLAFGDEVTANEEVVYFTVQFPHAMQTGSLVCPHIHVVPEDATAGVAQFELSYSWADINGTFPNATTETIDCTMPEVADKHSLYSFTDIDGSSITGVSSMMICALKRKSGNAGDTYNGKSVYLLEIDFHYQADSLGSRKERVK